MATTMKLIASVTLGADAATISLSSIPATYTDLRIVTSLRSTRSADSDNQLIKFNSSSTGYSERVLYGGGSSTASYSATYGIEGACPASTATANTFSNDEWYIPNYAGSTNKSVSMTSVSENNVTVVGMLAVAGLWANTAAITDISFSLWYGPNFKAGSSVYLYGITKF